MADNDKDQRTEEASPKRRRDTEEKGQFAISKEVNSAFVLLGSLLVFIFMGGQITQDIMKMWGGFLSNIGTTQLNEANAFVLLQNVFKGALMVLTPVFIGLLVAGVLANLLQTGGLKFSAKPLEPKFSRLNPMKGFGRLFSKHSVMELLKSIFKMLVIALITYNVIKNEFFNIPLLMDMSPGQTMLYIGDISLKIMMHTLWALIILSIIDYGFQKYTHLEGMKMTKQEVKEERKETEGDPFIKARIRNIQAQLARKRMMAEVPKAEVVITNPLHYAIAIQYEKDTMEAPVVVAKGANYLAKKIKEIAKEHGIPVVENKPLAQSLFKLVEVGGVIPHALFKAVAEVLAYIYRLQGKDKGM